MKKLAVVLVVLLLLSCRPWWNVSPEYDPRFAEIPVLGIVEPSDAGVWLVENITGVGDGIHDMAEYWQSPDQTYVWRTGDCEDFAILMMYFLHTELGGWPQLAIGTCGTGKRNGHAWVIYEGRWYEAQGGADVTDNPDYVLLEAIPYGEAMWRSMNGHKAMKEGR